jgi:hypothetical protein
MVAPSTSSRTSGSANVSTAYSGFRQKARCSSRAWRATMSAGGEVVGRRDLRVSGWQYRRVL